jgi:chromosome segregation ATPase
MTETATGEAPLGDNAPSTEMTATADAMRAAAAEGCELARRERTEAGELMNAARAEVARILTEAETKARELSASAGQREQDARGLEARAGWLDTAAGIQGQAEEADAAAIALDDEHAELTAQLAELSPRIARLLSEREDVAGQLADARADADVDRATHLGARLEGLDGVLATLNGQHSAITSRLATLGDADGGLLGEAIRAAHGHHRDVRRILGDVWPDRPEAVRDRAVAELQAALEANVARIADMQRGAQPQRPNVVHL